MLEAFGNLSEVVAYSAFDIGNYDAAEHYFEFAMSYADQGKSLALRAKTLAEMSRNAAYLGDLDGASSLIEFAQVRSDRVSATARVMLWTIRAHLLALTRRTAEAIADVQCADEHLTERDPAVDTVARLLRRSRTSRPHRQGTRPSGSRTQPRRTGRAAPANRYPFSSRRTTRVHGPSPGHVWQRCSRPQVNPRNSIRRARGRHRCNVAAVEADRQRAQPPARAAEPHVRIGDVAQLLQDIASLGHQGSPRSIT